MKYDTRVQAWRDRLVDCNTHVCERKWLTKSRSLRIFCWKPQLFKAFNTTVQGRLLRRSHQSIFVILFVVSLSSLWAGCFEDLAKEPALSSLLFSFLPPNFRHSEQTIIKLFFFFSEPGQRMAMGKRSQHWWFHKHASSSQTGPRWSSVSRNLLAHGWTPRPGYIFIVLFTLIPRPLSTSWGFEVSACNEFKF